MIEDILKTIETLNTSEKELVLNFMSQLIMKSYDTRQNILKNNNGQTASSSTMEC